jgi:predicted nucleotidyltransferase
VAAAKQEASMAAMVGETRQEAVWSLTKQVHELQERLRYAVDIEEVEALEAELARATFNADARAEAAAESRIKAAEAAALAAKHEASLAAMVGEARQEAVWSLTKQVNQLQEQLRYAVDSEEVEALEAQLAQATVKAEAAAESRIKAAEAATAAAKVEASLAAMVGQARQEAVWSLTKQVKELQEQLSYAASDEEVEALQMALAAANAKLKNSISMDDVEEMDEALAAVTELAISEAESRVRAAEAAVQAAKSEASLAAMVGESRQEAMRSLTQQVRELEEKLRNAVDVEEVEALQAELAQATSKAEARAEAAAESRIKAAEAALEAVRQEATLAAMVGQTRQEAVWSLTQQVHELQEKLRYAVDIEEVEALEAALAQATSNAEAKAEAAAESRIKAAEAATEAAKLEASLAAMVGEARQEAVWSLTKQVKELQEQLSYAASDEEVEALQAALSTATDKLRNSISMDDVQEMDAALAAVTELAIREAEQRVRAAEAATEAAKQEATLAAMVGDARQEAVLALTKQVQELQEKLRYAVDVEEVKALEAALASATKDAVAAAEARVLAAKAEAAAAKQEARLAAMVNESRQEAMWALTKEVELLEDELSNSTSTQEVRAHDWLMFLVLMQGEAGRVHGDRAGRVV